uniref:Uncharacterized protein n=1 Tax=Candidatus Kentrum sp. TUN TaxID=2126343 RepID=A0A450ZU37_9GAMM|nr:MAG: hypothetical protein BECKTUN1418F_GA0071002_11116 [Candidatus Kentron sp. TUN]VFK60193.1 MAG: hypothetical protein BECKTUN1418D_GA0071000_11186 [Candidatus Kentron sp. TUN]VFK65433.1 MAG: hypothetical protein BECKTUN1418E_GA0071001_11076 [Candidatus Kentron sp. TUN]
MKKKFTIESRRLLAVEGKDECNFFEALLKHMGIEDIQLADIGGKDRFKTEFDLLYQSKGFSDVCALGLIRDAEDKKADAAFKSICSILEKHPPLPVPEAANTAINGKNDTGKLIRIGVFIMPNNADQGMLEDLCLESLESIEKKPAFPCMEQYMNCLSKLPENDTPRNPAKAKVQTYLATRKEIVNSLGLGARKGYWDFEHDCFNEIKRFLGELL